MEIAEWRLLSFEISLFKAPRQIVVTGPDPRTVPLTMMPEMSQNTVKQWGKKSSLYTESTTGSTSISCADAGTYMSKPTQGICLCTCVWLEKEDMPHVVIYHVCALGEGQATGCWDCKKFLCDLLLRTVCFSPPNQQPEVRYYLCPCPVLLIFPLSFSSAAAAASEVQMVEFTALAPKQEDLWQDYLN